ncbi:hypothetical protein Tco_1045050 [Tanacetum coccineum]|uniref:Uncharacterized protein n=1 Tax=Tanacetum coccineum TaxID=301880 RepID=A0ABQ5GSG9_9ASTR
MKIGCQCWMYSCSGNPAGISSGKISENSVSKGSTSCGTSEIGVFSSSTTKPRFRVANGREDVLVEVKEIHRVELSIVFWNFSAILPKDQQMDPYGGAVLVAVGGVVEVLWWRS